MPEETVTSSNFTTVGCESRGAVRAWEPMIEFGMAAVVDEQFDRTALSIFTTLELRTAGTVLMAGTEVSVGDTEVASAVQQA